MDPSFDEKNGVSRMAEFILQAGKDYNMLQDEIGLFPPTDNSLYILSHKLS